MNKGLVLGTCQQKIGKKCNQINRLCEWIQNHEYVSYEIRSGIDIHNALKDISKKAEVSFNIVINSLVLSTWTGKRRFSKRPGKETIQRIADELNVEFIDKVFRGNIDERKR